MASGGEALRQCMQCATCSSVCGLSADHKPFPRKEMLWAQWGLRDRLVADPDIWLCHECHECTLRCPRGARPGDVMAALRRECITNYGAPASLSRAAAHPVGLLVFVALASTLLYAGSLVWESSGMTARELVAGGERIVIPFWTAVPHGLIVALFGAVLVFDTAVLAIGASRFWSAMQRHAGPDAWQGASRSAQGTNVSPAMSAVITPWGRSLVAGLKRVVWHDDFAECGHEAQRHSNHSLVFYAMAGLVVVDLWVLVARFNPLRSGLVYPMAFSNPWKLLANLAGLVLLIGCTSMLLQRLDRADRLQLATRSSGLPDYATHRSGTYSDWLLLALLVVAALTGFATEGLHFLRVDGARHAAYAVHLVSVLTFFLILPYSKLAHVVYRSAALVFAERFGTRRRTALAVPRTGSDQEAV